MSSSYQVHGTCDIKCENNIMKIDAMGPWNFEYFDYLHSELIKAVSQVNMDNFAVLLNLSGEAIAVEQAIDKHVNFVSKSKAKAIAINLADCSTVVVTKKIFDKGYGAANVKYDFFMTKEDATNWLTSELN